MAKRFGVLEADQPQTAEPRAHVSKSAARYLLRKMLALPVAGRDRIIQMVKIAVREIGEIIRPTPHYDGPLGTGNALPFSRQSDGSPLHYEMPHAGDVGLWRHYKKKIRVSARPQSHLAAQFIRRTQPLTLPGSPNVLSLGAS